MTKTYEKEYCMSCGKENPQDKGICECGSRNFVFGNHFTFENKEVVCGCGNNKFQMALHMNMNPIYTKTYKCSECGNSIGIQTYYKSPYV